MRRRPLVASVTNVSSHAIKFDTHQFEPPNFGPIWIQFHSIPERDDMILIFCSQDMCACSRKRVPGDGLASSLFCFQFFILCRRV